MIGEIPPQWEMPPWISLLTTRARTTRDRRQATHGPEVRHAGQPVVTTSKKSSSHRLNRHLAGEEDSLPPPHAYQLSGLGTWIARGLAWQDRTRPECPGIIDREGAIPSERCPPILLRSIPGHYPLRPQLRNRRMDHKISPLSAFLLPDRRRAFASPALNHGPILAAAPDEIRISAEVPLRKYRVVHRAVSKQPRDRAGRCISLLRNVDSAKRYQHSIARVCLSASDAESQRQSETTDLAENNHRGIDCIPSGA